MTLPAQILPEHHRHCDELFVAAEESVRRSDWKAAAAALTRFHDQLKAHFEAEEGLLFPAFESATGMSGGPTRMMRYEHEQMRNLLEQLAVACAAHDGNGYAGDAESLLILMQQHNMKEENILYPMCDRALGADAERLGAKLNDMLEKRHA